MENFEKRAEKIAKEITFATDDKLNILNVDSEPHTITFHADEIAIGSDKLCLGFKDMPLALDKIKTLEFHNMKGDKVFVYKRDE